MPPNPSDVPFGGVQPVGAHVSACAESAEDGSMLPVSSNCSKALPPPRASQRNRHAFPNAGRSTGSLTMRSYGTAGPS